MTRRKRDAGWYVIFTLLAVVLCVVIYFLSGRDALGAALRLVWSGVVFTSNAIVRLVTSFTGLLMRGVGVRRVSRIVTAVGGIGLGYAGAVVLSDRRIRQAHDWRDWFRRLASRGSLAWRRLSFPSKLLVAVTLVVVQLYLHWMLIVFPIGFLVPVVRRAWVQLADTALGNWYWQTIGPWHRAAMSAGRRLPVVRELIGCIRLTRLRYLTAWRLWRHHPRYRDRATGKRTIDLTEPVRLWWRGELDIYRARPLLSGRRQQAREDNSTGP